MVGNKDNGVSVFRGVVKYCNGFKFSYKPFIVRLPKGLNTIPPLNNEVIKDGD